MQTTKENETKSQIQIISAQHLLLLEIQTQEGPAWRISSPLLGEGSVVLHGTWCHMLGVNVCLHADHGMSWETAAATAFQSVSCIQAFVVLAEHGAGISWVLYPPLRPWSTQLRYVQWLLPIQKYQQEWALPGLHQRSPD